MERQPVTAARPQLGRFPFVMAGTSFVPFFGILPGLAALVWGLCTQKGGGRMLAVVGLAGILFSVSIYSALFYFGFVHRGGTYDRLRGNLALSTLNAVVHAIEFHKTRNGSYPESLEALRDWLPGISPVTIFDPTQVRSFRKPGNFYYEVIDGEHYHLLGVGADGVPFTDDDITPRISDGPVNGSGLLTNQAEGRRAPDADGIERPRT